MASSTENFIRLQKLYLDKVNYTCFVVCLAKIIFQAEKDFQSVLQNVKQLLESISRAQDR